MDIKPVTEEEKASWPEEPFAKSGQRVQFVTAAYRQRLWPWLERLRYADP